MVGRCSSCCVLLLALLLVVAHNIPRLELSSPALTQGRSSSSCFVLLLPLLYKNHNLHMHVKPHSYPGPWQQL
jgi:hypothetical protein